MSASPISYQEIDAYTRLMNIRLSAFEVSAIKRLDGVALRESAKDGND